MEPKSLHNQLRFNINVPYNINKLSVRHRKPQPIVIEKANTEAPDQHDKATSLDVNHKFDALDLEKLKEAQFLVQREIKKNRQIKLPVETAKLVNAKPVSRPTLSSSQRTRENYVNKQPLKIVPNRTAQKLPISGNSPPVRDFKKRPSKPTGSPDRHRKLSSSKEVSSVERRDVRRECKRGISREKVVGTDQPFSTADLHKMAIDQLVRVKQGDYNSPTSSTKTRECHQKKTQAKKSSLNRTPKKRSHIHPSVRAGVNRIARERTYSQKLQPRPLPRCYSAESPQPRAGQRSISYPGQREMPYRTHSLPDPDTFIQNVINARRANQMSQDYLTNPRKIIDRIEREARDRLEPLLHQAQEISKTMMNAVEKNKSKLNVATPQYDTRDTSPDVSNGQSTADASEIDPPSMLTYRHTEASVQPSNKVTAEELDVLNAMLERLDGIEREQSEISSRWAKVSTQYPDNLGLVPLRSIQDKEPIDYITEHPEPLLLKKPEIPDNINCAKPLYTKAHHNNSPTKQDPMLSLPVKKIKSIQDGKIRYQKYLDSIFHSVSRGFNPWDFAEQTADDILEMCIHQVAEELVGVSEGLIQDLYSNEFIAATHTAPFTSST